MLSSLEGLLEIANSQMITESIYAVGELEGKFQVVVLYIFQL